MIWLMTGAWCAQALIHDISMERRSINANPALSPSSREKLCQKVTLSPDPHLSFALNPTIHPSSSLSARPSNHPCLSQQHLHSFLTLSLPLYPSRSFSLLSRPVSRYLVFLSPLLIPNLHPIQAGGFQWGANVRKDKLRRLCMSTQTLCLIWIVLPERIFQSKERQKTKTNKL